MREYLIKMLRDALEPILRDYINGIKAVNIRLEFERKGEPIPEPFPESEEPIEVKYKIIDP